MLNGFRRIAWIIYDLYIYIYIYIYMWEREKSGSDYSEIKIENREAKGGKMTHKRSCYIITGEC